MRDTRIYVPWRMKNIHMNMREINFETSDARLVLNRREQRALLVKWEVEYRIWAA